MGNLLSFDFLFQFQLKTVKHKLKGSNFILKGFGHLH